LVIVLGTVLRTYGLNQRPIGFTWDEAALGYNAYSLLKTGKDEHGQVLPVVFKSFGDYKPGLYVYFALPTVKLLGLNEVATRLPSAISGVLLIIVLYLLTKNLYVAFLAAINPLLLEFSRGAWEANVFILLVTLGTVLFVKKKYLLVGVFFGLTFWTYQGAKMFTPMLILLLLYVYKKHIQIKKIWLGGITLFLFLIPIILGLSTQSGRLKVFSVFSYTRSPEVVSEILKQDSGNKFISTLFNSEILDQTRGVVQRYLNYFSPRFLFFDGDWSNSRQTIIYHGNQYLFEFLTLILGSFSGVNPFIWGWLILAPLPAALSRDIVTSVRALPMMIPLIILSGLGAKKINKYLLLFLSFLSLVRFIDLYWNHDFFFSADDWVSAYKQSVQRVVAHQDEYKNVYFTNLWGQPYIYLLFYQRYDPAKYQTNHVYREGEGGDVGNVESFGKYKFGKVYWPTMRSDANTLFVGGQYELVASDIDNTLGATSLGEIGFPNGDIAFRLVGKK
jgi:4-amino-4-deoxy-L-arabinose transferase-like glycosyltransferase